MKKTMIRRGARSAALALAAGVSLGAHAATTVLAMDSLPTAQGWTYDSCWWGCNVPPASTAWTADGVSLTLNAYAGSGISGFSLLNAVDSAQPFVIDTRLKVTGGNVPYFYLGALTSTHALYAALSTNMLRIYWVGGTTDIALDATSFHDYQIAATPGGLVTVKIDGATAYQSANAWYAIDPNSIPNSLNFGDGTSGADGTAVMTSYSFTQTAAPVPEAGTLSLMALGLVGGLLWRRRVGVRR